MPGNVTNEFKCPWCLEPLIDEDKIQVRELIDWVNPGQVEEVGPILLACKHGVLVGVDSSGGFLPEHEPAVFPFWLAPLESVSEVSFQRPDP